MSEHKPDIAHPRIASYPFNEPSADITLRTRDGVDFYVYRPILSLASPVFADMFSLPQPATPKQDQIIARPVIDITEDSKTIERLLRLCYPIEKEKLDEFEDIVAVLQAAMKYDMKWPISSLTVDLLAIVPHSPLKVWAIASYLITLRYGLTDCARLAAREVLEHSIAGVHVHSMESPSSTALAYHRLLQYYDACAAAVDACIKAAAAQNVTMSDNNIATSPALGHPFDLPSTDITLRSADNVDFPVHKLILSVSSAFFRDMLSLPPPRDDATSTKSLSPPSPVVPLAEDGKTIERLLRLCYPIDKQPLDDLKDIAPVLKAALKYDMEWPIRLLTRDLLAIMPKAPLKVWAYACQCGLEDLARSAAREVLGESTKGDNTKSSRLVNFGAMLGSIGLDVLEGVTASDYFRLREYILSGECEARFVALSPNLSDVVDTSTGISRAPEHHAASFYPPVPRPDLTLRCLDTTTHHAHEAILSLHSSVFGNLIDAERARQTRESGAVYPRVELEVEVNSDTLTVLLELCYGNTSGLPSSSSSSSLDALLVAVERYNMVLIHKIVKDRWDEIARTNALDAYFVALRHGLTSQARVGARGVLDSPINGAYARSMESTSALSYHRLLDYYACGAAVEAKMQDTIPQWNVDIQEATRLSYERSSSNDGIREGGIMERHLCDIAGRSEEGPGRVIAKLAFSSLLMLSDYH
ncbi:hypothetical protein DICSQDRAFT_112048 [Dichomitus squalens LYAD-421 SS1]|uniref:BTB domain-containing protein n=1 Tax=Dichomitus squalens (strain LYAD-421) TaxID=732165 RepID=R7SMX3_DICSQ|nr:uncharacterized protein DICSQDRAFT_112048 [Dichomitus squalens LYAD-421 SS1]EJF57228.1 hypothetical protein DICSQDRAFT_112048 [Dichomitus squalens LYAD-421 SS1]